MAKSQNRKRNNCFWKALKLSFYPQTWQYQVTWSCYKVWNPNINILFCTRLHREAQNLSKCIETGKPSKSCHSMEDEWICAPPIERNAHQFQLEFSNQRWRRPAISSYFDVKLGRIGQCLSKSFIQTIAKWVFMPQKYRNSRQFSIYVSKLNKNFSFNRKKYLKLNKLKSGRITK